jgi:hypothetical protein
MITRTLTAIIKAPTTEEADVLTDQLARSCCDIGNSADSERSSVHLVDAAQGNYPNATKAPSTPAARAKVWSVRISYTETLYVERDAFVVADTDREAMHRALLDQLIDSGEDHCEQLTNCIVNGLVEGYEPQVKREATDEDLRRAAEVNDNDELEAEFGKDEAADCPLGDPDCPGNNGDCHDACEGTDKIERS